MRLFSSFSFIAVFGALFLASCVVVEEQRPLPPGPPPPGDRTQACPMIYAPVCGQRRGERQTFGNDCVARSEGFRVVHEGECRRESSRPGRPDREARACTREYAPVCGRRGGQERTFGNRCEAQAANFRVVADRPCRRG